jgi:sterol desaturase/sphingolipid hydroxylase (fatty acid hydroxylase superfamily)
MRRAAIMTSLSAGVMRRARHFGDFVTVPLAIAIFVDLAGIYRLHLVLAGIAAWTLLEYLVHRFVFHRHAVGQRLHQLHHDHPSDPDAERSSLSTPLLAFPIGYLLIGAAGVEDGSAIFAGLLLGYLAFIAVHYAVHRWPIEPGSWLYPAKLRHLTHHCLEDCNFGVTTIFWDIVFRTQARAIGGRLRSGAGSK